MLALLSDIHGNLPAFEAVVADARARGADRFVLCGDYAAMGPWPAECVDLAESLEPLVMLRGNHERWHVDPSDMPVNPVLTEAVAWETDRLGTSTTARLGALPATATLDGMLLCHASPPSDMESFLPEPDAELEARLLNGIDAPRVVFGHTHLQFRRTSEEGPELVNPGSVGLPLDGVPEPAYAMVADDGTLTLHRVAHGRDAMLQGLQAVDTDWARWITGWVRNARP
jgi:predicted phosphodiesterase